MYMELMLYRDAFREQVIDVWERSVRATHLFLLDKDLEIIKALVKMVDFDRFITFCAMEGDRVVGFLAVKEKKLEMLFLDPAFIGKGIGAEMVSYAISKLRVTEVDVNEQNTHALEFYKRMGFVAYARNEKDGLGKAYPIISMRLLDHGSKVSSVWLL